MDFNAMLKHWLAHVKSVFLADEAKVKVDLQKWGAEVLPQAEKLLEAVGEDVFKAAGTVVLGQITGGASYGLALDAGIKVLEGLAPKELAVAGKQVAVLALSKALPGVSVVSSGASTYNQ